MLGDDSLFILLSAIFIWLLLRALRGADHWWLYALLGLLLGLSIATKYSTGLLPLAIIPVVWWRARQAGWRWFQVLGRLGLAWLFTLIGSSWWFGWLGYYFNTIEEEGLFFGLLRPILAAGPDVSMKRVFALFTATPFTGPERPDAVAAGTFWDWLVYLFQTFWGVPVLESYPFVHWLYLLMLLFVLLALVGLWQLGRQVAGRARLTLAVLGLIVALLIPFPLLRFFLTHNVLETGQGRHILYPAAQAIPIMPPQSWATSVSGSSTPAWATSASTSSTRRWSV
jgi:4-amino-4-deoxy-L-arabinose transferase-like glycosyltransferase